ncbi:ribonuclease H-like domain-containing protein [Bacillus solitudinis]|uniref:ribonuclease H-like domain-containing protein n=1 Tax=Bacillus solitudinis TaxID=2014074 RepID=UPI000C24A474|nr:ribonuclease H-like domain-containing protein [Bacillus solitudinis]
MALKSKLNLLKKHMSLEKDVKPFVGKEMKHPSPQLMPFEEKWNELGASPYWFEGNYTMVRDVYYPLDYQHGAYKFIELKRAVENWQDHIASHPLSTKNMQAKELLFFDTETTGLSSGAGNTIFLLGYSQVREEDVHVRQYFLPGPEAEVALYHHFLTDVGQMKNLVTYNGKAFDWPQVKTRHTFVRDQVPKLPQFGHYDLLHASRRLWKDILPSCKLSIVESDILKFKREEDTPSYLVPMLYFDFMNEQNPEFIKGVLQHHEWDVLSLITLYTHLSFTIMSKSQASLHPKERFELARWYEYVGEKDLALLMYEELTSIKDSLAFDSLFAYANLVKQKKETNLALQAYLSLMNSNSFVFDSAIECSKIYEHQLKDIEKAYHYAEVAKNFFEENKGLIQGYNQRKKGELEKRLNRLEQKLKK